MQHGDADMMNLFRLVALVEGVTTLALFFVAMPLKYILGAPVLAPATGWPTASPSSPIVSS